MSLGAQSTVIKRSMIESRPVTTSLPSAPAFRRALSLAACLIWSGALVTGSTAAQQIIVPSLPPAAPVPAATASPNSTAPSQFRITGTVINSVTGAPVARAELSVSRMSARRVNGRGSSRNQEQTSATVAAAAGRFQIEVPSAGGWSLTASAHGYNSQAYDAHDGFSTAIILTDAAPVFDLTFRLPPTSAIEGFVLDEAGEAVRNAQITVSFVPPAAPDEAHPRHQVRGNQRTDDRGYYKVSGLLAGDYQIRLQAQPWYATAAAGQRFGRVFGIGAASGGVAGSILSEEPAATGAPATDPLDVVYPLVWYPGVSEYSAATSLSVRPGEIREADFRLSPVPGFHLRIPAENPPPTDARRPAIQSGVSLSQVLPDGGQLGVPTAMNTDADGNIEFSGLAPGSYIIRRPGDSANGAPSAALKISPNSPRSVDLNQATPATPVTVKIDPAADLPSLQISFRDLDSGSVTFAQTSQNLGGAPRGRRRDTPDRPSPSAADNSPSAPQQSADRTVSLQPGRYTVSLSGINDLHLTAIEATGASATGRIVTIGGGAPSLLLHVAAGRANVTGVVHVHGDPDPGAMVLLVPATLGDPSGLDIIRRDQSNSDGSFDILDVLPGAYILVAIDRGWGVNWHDPSTLRRFLMHGLPLDLTAPGDRRETIEGQSP